MSFWRAIFHQSTHQSRVRKAWGWLKFIRQFDNAFLLLVPSAQCTGRGSEWTDSQTPISGFSEYVQILNFSKSSSAEREESFSVEQEAIA